MTIVKNQSSKSPQLNPLPQQGEGTEEMGSVAIRLIGVSKRYNHSKFRLNIDHLEFCKDNIYVLVGPNGSGKSTILQLIARLIEPDRGKIVFKGFSSENGGNGLWQKKIGFLRQRPYLFDMSVSENIALGLKIRRYPRERIVSKVNDMLELLEIRALAKHKPKVLSGGEYQKVAIAQILAIEPQIILLDEPTEGMDAQSVLSVEELVKTLQRKNRSTVIMTTHSLSQAYRMSSHIVSLREGKIANFIHRNVFFGQVEEIAGDLQSMRICEGVEIVFSTERRGKVYIAIDPGSIIVSRETVKTSARNTFRGKLIKMEEVGANIQLVIDIGVPIYSIITKQSFREMGINLGAEVYVSFKVNSVEVI